MSIDFGYEVLCIASMTVLVVLALVCLVRCIMGPRISCLLYTSTISLAEL